MVSVLWAFIFILPYGCTRYEQPPTQPTTTHIYLLARARHIILTSRSGSDSLKKINNVMGLRILGYLKSHKDLTIQLHACDASSESDTSNLVSSLTSPLGGCILMSVVLSDRLLVSHGIPRAWTCYQHTRLGFPAYPVICSYAWKLWTNELWVFPMLSYTAPRCWTAQPSRMVRTSWPTQDIISGYHGPWQAKVRSPMDHLRPTNWQPFE